ncbi:MAG: hypothetical protein JRN52_02450 [Nitrososphaerota archaeon]|nr:hypothetical protein [Nitrososphaerota archaeon]
MSKSSKNRKPKAAPKSLRLPIIIGIIITAIIVISAGIFLLDQHTTTTTTNTAVSNKPIILYVNQGNGLVDESNFSSLVSFAKTNGFNTIFFQVYRSGTLLFTQSELTYFVSDAHVQNLNIFFALYFTDSTQKIPTSIFGLGENGISLDMSTLPTSTQEGLLQTLKQNYLEGKTAMTTTNFTTTLNPDLLILETYQSSDQSYIHPGIIAGVEPLAIASKQDYEQQFEYALAHSDGVMVFDYYGLLKTGY